MIYKIRKIGKKQYEERVIKKKKKRMHKFIDSVISKYEKPQSISVKVKFWFEIILVTMTYRYQIRSKMMIDQCQIYLSINRIHNRAKIMRNKSYRYEELVKMIRYLFAIMVLLLQLYNVIAYILTYVPNFIYRVLKANLKRQ